MTKPLKQQAIEVALTGNWKEAAKLNIEILKEDPQDTESLNRLAFALIALGKNKLAKESYEKVLDIDPLNPIAQRGMKRLSSGMKKVVNPPTQLISNMFLEESGKTKIITLVNTAPSRIVRNLQVGQIVGLVKKRNKIFVQDLEKIYLGVLPDDIGKRLIKFIDGGNTYEAYIKSASDKGITIFVKEIKRVSKFKNQPSFLFGDKTHLTFDKSVLKNHLSEEE